MTSTPIVVGAYARVALTDERAISRQQQDIAALVAARGWTAAHYVDNGAAEYFREKSPRPSFDRLLADLDAGTVGGVVAYDLDRICRGRQLEQLLARYDANPSLVFALCHGELNLGAPAGRRSARMMSVVYNAAAKSARTTADRRAAAAARKRAQA